MNNTQTTEQVLDTLNTLVNERVSGLAFKVTYTQAGNTEANKQHLEALQDVQEYVKNGVPENLTEEMKEAILEMCKLQESRINQQIEMLEREFKAFEKFANYLQRKQELQAERDKLNSVKRVHEFYKHFNIR